MGNDLFDPFENDEVIEEILTDDDIEQAPKKHWGKIIAVLVIGLVCLGLIGNYVIQRSGFRKSGAGRVIFPTNYTEDGVRYLVNKTGGYDKVDLSIRTRQFEKRRTSKDGVQIKMLVTVNYWPNQNYLDYQYKFFKATSNNNFDIDGMTERFIFDTLASYISENKSPWLLENSAEMGEEIQSLFDERIRKAFVFEYFGNGKNERLVEYLELAEVDTEQPLEERMFERNKWGNYAYLIESSDNYKKYFIIDDFIRIGTVKIDSVEKVEWD